MAKLLHFSAEFLICFVIGHSDIFLELPILTIISFTPWIYMSHLSFKTFPHFVFNSYFCRLFSSKVFDMVYPINTLDFVLLNIAEFGIYIFFVPGGLTFQLVN